MSKPESSETLSIICHSLLPEHTFHRAQSATSCGFSEERLGGLSSHLRKSMGKFVQDGLSTSPACFLAQ